jgi:aldose 1-epimerase
MPAADGPSLSRRPNRPRKRMPATRFSWFTTDVGGLDAVSITDNDRSARATIALRGATLLRWTARIGGRDIDLVDGYIDQAEFESQDGVRNGIMLPFVNRIADARYTFADRTYDLLPGRSSNERLIYHGMLRQMNLTLSDVHTTHSGTRVEFVTSVQPGAIPGYPFSLDIRISYLLSPRAIGLTIHATNTGPTIAPYAAGWHPYFRLGTNLIDDLQIKIPADCIIRTRNLIPLDGADAYTPIADEPQLDFRQLQAINNRKLDVSFSDLARDADGYINTLLLDPSINAGIRVRQRRGLMHVYTGDTLIRGRRRSLALEPVDNMTNAFNRPDCHRHITLYPGQTRTYHCTVDILELDTSGSIGSSSVKRR